MMLDQYLIIYIFPATFLWGSEILCSEPTK